MIRPRSISGLREFLPAEQITFNRCVAIVQKHFELAGAVPLSTPAFELRDVLLAKEGGDSVDRQVYGVHRIADGGEDTDFALRFDLTVPMARFVAQHAGELVFPFRRYQIQPVWRGERAQAGRYREFIQCDIDVVGDQTLSLVTDAEIPAIIDGIFKEMNIGPFQIRMSNRKLLEGFLSGTGIPSESISDAMRVIDKIDKVGPDEIRKELAETYTLNDKQLDLIMAYVSLRGPAEEVIEKLLALVPADSLNEIYKAGVEELTTVARAAASLGLTSETFILDLSVARGLSYYTGTVYETTLVDHPSIGSICSGGRYENLAGLYTNRKLPGVGISIGLTRLVSRLMEAGLLPVDQATTAPVLVTVLDPDKLDRYLTIAGTLRQAGIGAEVATEQRKVGQQFKYADRKGFKLALVAGEDEFAAGSWQVKTLATGDQVLVEETKLVETLKEMLAR